MKYWKTIVGAALITGLALGLHALVPPHFVRPANAQLTLSLPFATVTNVAQSSTQIVAANPSRRSIQICVPAVAVVLHIVPAPATATATSGVGMVGSATTAGPICYSPPANVLNSGTAGGAGAAWNAFVTAGTVAVTVLEW